LRGEKEPARTFHLDRLDIKHIWEGYNLIQEQFAAMLVISVHTLCRTSVYQKVRRLRTWV